MTASVWDDPELKTNDDYIAFDNVGDTVTGRIINIRAHRFDDGKVVPQILLDTAEGERTLTAGQIRLKTALSEQRPEAGDTLTVTLTQIEKRAGGKTLKHFDVAIVRGGGAPATAPAAAATPPAAPATSPSAAANLGLTEEQKAGLRAMGVDVPE